MVMLLVNNNGAVLNLGELPEHLSEEDKKQFVITKINTEKSKDPSNTIVPLKGFGFGKVDNAGRQGNWVFYNYDDNKNPAEEAFFVNGGIQGIKKSYNQSGKLETVDIYSENVRSMRLKVSDNHLGFLDYARGLFDSNAKDVDQFTDAQLKEAVTHFVEKKPYLK